jgi:L-ascorbate metabolism protein UlaG (beta-lactamase superfamily)
MPLATIGGRMAHDPDSIFPSGPTTRRGLLSAFGRRAAQSLPVPNIPGLEGSGPLEDEWFDDEPPDSIEPLLVGEAFVEEVRASATETGMHVWWLGQSGFLVQVNGECLLLDPYLSDTMTQLHAGTATPYERITGIVADPELLSFVDLVATSNARLDHLDPGTLPQVLAGGAPFVCSAGSEQVAAERAGREPDAVLGPHDQVELGGFIVRGVPAYHAEAPETVGFIVRHGAYSLYHAGDTRRVQGIAETVSLYGVDVALVPINGTHGNMNGADAARLAYEAEAGIAIACHYEMFRNDTASSSRFVAECVRLGQEYRLPRAGERITVDYGY